MVKHKLFELNILYPGGNKCYLSKVTVRRSDAFLEKIIDFKCAYCYFETAIGKVKRKNNHFVIRSVIQYAASRFISEKCFIKHFLINAYYKCCLCLEKVTEEHSRFFLEYAANI